MNHSEFTREKDDRVADLKGIEFRGMIIGASGGGLAFVLSVVGSSHLLVFLAFWSLMVSVASWFAATSTSFKLARLERKSTRLSQATRWVNLIILLFSAAALIALGYKLLRF